MELYNWANSNCVNGWLHRYQIVANYPEAVIEQCEICHKCKAFRTDEEGRPNNLEYIAHHIRQVLVPEHALYQHEYPKNKKYEV